MVDTTQPGASTLYEQLAGSASPPSGSPITEHGISTTLTVTAPPGWGVVQDVVALAPLDTPIGGTNGPFSVPTAGVGTAASPLTLLDSPSGASTPVLGGNNPASSTLQTIVNAASPMLSNYPHAPNNTVAGITGSSGWPNGADGYATPATTLGSPSSLNNWPALASTSTFGGAGTSYHTTNGGVIPTNHAPPLLRTRTVRETLWAPPGWD